MTRIFFADELDTVATFWRVFRRDGVTVGFTAHDRDLAFGGIRHQAAPGMIPAAIRLSGDFTEDEAEMRGALSHAAIREDDLAAGLYDEAAIEFGVVDWMSLEHHCLYNGTLGAVEIEQGEFTCELASAKRLLQADIVPRTSPTCRAEFCGPGCGLTAQVFSSRRELQAVDHAGNRVLVGDVGAGDAQLYLDGQIRFLDGAQTGIAFTIMVAEEGWLTLDRPLASSIIAGLPLELRQGCDHTIASCAERFGNAINFRGEPFLPGNDLLARTGSSSL